MQDKVLAKTAVADFIKGLIQTAKTIAPVRKPGGFFKLEPVSQPEQVALDCTISYYSPKEYLLPSCETLLKFGTVDGKPVVEPVVDSEETILFGPHPCDINAIALLDAAFEKDNSDSNYLERRRHMTIIGIDCLKPCDENSFCCDMKTNVVHDGYDLFLTDIGDAYFVRVATDRGAQLLGNADDPTPEQRAALDEANKTKATSFKKRIEYDTDELPELLENNYQSPIWGNTAKRCYSCGTCNLVCPTCYCFDVADKLELNLTDGHRERVWDSCQIASFAEVAGGENFRAERGDRLRHRFFRKGKLIREMYDRPGCVGCGRCDRSCTAKISSVDVYNELKGGV